MPKKETNLDAAWNALDSEYELIKHIEADGVVELTAEQIHAVRESGKYKGVKFEPRLLTHFDNRQQQPSLFLDNNVSILPKQRGSYVIGTFNPFVSITDYEKFETIHIRPVPLVSATADNRMNEAMGLNYALACGILQDFTGQELKSTIAGRHAAGTWNYGIKSGKATVKLLAENPQIEVDGGYEGPDSIVLTEAKNNIVQEFCLRQLYFPYRTWLNKVKKPIRCVFVAISGDDYYLVEYVFPDPELFHANRIKTLHYIVDANEITETKLIKLFNNAVCKPEPEDIPFPQADNTRTTFDIIEYYGQNAEVDKWDIAKYVGFTDRQSDYFCNSAAYFGFLERNGNGRFTLTPRGKSFCNASTRKRKELFASALFERPVFRDCYQYYLENEVIPDRNATIEIMKRHIKLNTEGMYTRRSSTVRSWTKWLADITEEYRGTRKTREYWIS